MSQPELVARPPEEPVVVVWHLAAGIASALHDVATYRNLHGRRRHALVEKILLDSLRAHGGER